jgi:hypothetical protein
VEQAQFVEIEGNGGEKVVHAVMASV